MRETDLGVVQDDDALSDGCLEPSQDAIPVAVGRGDDVDRSAARARRPAATRRASRRAAGQDGRRAARAGSPGRGAPGPAPGACSFGPVPGQAPARRTGCRRSLPVHVPVRAGSARARAAPRGDGDSAPTLSGPSVNLLESLAGEASARARADCRAPVPAGASRSSPSGSSRRRRSAIWIAPAEAGSSHCTSSSAITTGPRSATARSTSRTASPIACGSGGVSPGSASRSATSSARRRGRTSEDPTSSRTGPAAPRARQTRVRPPPRPRGRSDTR